MQIKRYEVAHLKEAMAQIRKDLGPDAIILSTKRIAGGSLTEVMAARDEGHSGVPSFYRKEVRQEDDLLIGIREEIGKFQSYIHALTQNMPHTGDISELQETMNVLCDDIGARNPSHLRAIYKQLITSGIARPKAMRLIETIKNNFPHEASDTYEKTTLIAEKLIARSLTKDNIKERRIRAIIGPTGVGKTTTLAKLAAHYSLEKKLKVGLITTDTYRIAASEQLKVYAKIMGLPIDIASERDVFMRSLANFAEKDLILVDTPGRSPNDDQSLNKLKSIFDPSIETVLLMSSVCSSKYLLKTAEHFRIFDYDRIILTKVDECGSFGDIYDVLDKIGKPVSYMTTGQNVPKDIEKATPERLAKLILHHRLN